MKKLVLTKQEPCWVVLNGAFGRFLDTVKAGVRPTSFRKYDHEEDVWCVHYKWVNWVVNLARQHYEDVRWDELPTRWQLLAAGAQPAADGSLLSDPTATIKNAFDTLHVAEDAPDEVIKAAYKALARKYHPDRGGDVDLFKKIDAAYQQIIGRRNRHTN